MNQLQSDAKIGKLLDTLINSFFEQSIAAATRIDASYRHLWESLYGLIRSGGKRLRPQMTIMAYQAFGGKDIDKIIPIAAAQELLHFSLLIHDDVIDRDYVRYGVPNIAGRYKVSYSKYVATPDDQTHYAHSAAVLGGDLMLSGAYQLVGTSNLSDNQKALAQGYLAQGIFEVAGGELLDTELSFIPYNKGDALKVAKYKTASYSFISPLMTGAEIAGIGESKKTALHDYALSLGIAYQLVDDLLGVFGDEEETGKSVSSDIVEGKRTFLIERALSSFSDSEKAVFMLAFGNPLATAMEVKNIKILLETSGAREATEKKINEYVISANKALNSLDLEAEHYEKFLAFITKVTERSS